MNIEFVIQDLLHAKNFITIPGFGSFVSKYQAARIVKSDYVKFIPPRKTIAFNPLLDTDDGVLISFLENEYRLTNVDAQKEIELFVNQTKQILESEKAWNWQGIGTFFYDTQKSLQFEASPIQNYLTDSYGLSDFSVHILPQEHALEEYIAKKKEQIAPLHKKIIKAAFIASPIIFGAILIPNILHTPQLAGFVSMFRDTEVSIDFSIPEKPMPFAYNNQVQSHDIMDTPIIDTQHVLTAQNQDSKDVEKPQIVESKPIKKIKKSQFSEVKSQTKLPVTSSIEGKSYFIIVGSFSTQKNAERLSKDLQKQAFESGIVTDGEKIRVYISAFALKNDAIKKLNEIKNLSDFSGAWLYTRNS